MHELRFSANADYNASLNLATKDIEKIIKETLCAKGSEQGCSRGLRTIGHGWLHTQKPRSVTYPKAQFRAIRRQGTRQGTNLVYVFHTYSSHFGDVCRYIPREGASWELNRVNALHLALGYIPREGASWEFKHRHERIAQRRYILARGCELGEHVAATAGVRRHDTSRARGASWELTWCGKRQGKEEIHPARGCELGASISEVTTRLSGYIPREGASWEHARI